MNRRVILSPDARANWEDAARWYHRHEKNLSRRFSAEVQSMLLRIARHPYAFVRVRSGRRATLSRFPYYIFFMFDGATVFVIGIRHQRRANIGF